MMLLKFQHRKKRVIVTFNFYNDDSIVNLSVTYGGSYLGCFSFVYYFSPQLFDNQSDDFECLLKTMVKSYIDVQLYGSTC